MSSWVGIDYGSKLAGTTVLAYAQSDRLVFLQSERKKDADAFLRKYLLEIKPAQIFIDAPLSLPLVYRSPDQADDFFYRQADRQLKAMSPMFLGGLTARAMRLANIIRSEEPLVFRETYPAYLAKILELPPASYKKDPQFLLPLSEQLSDQFGLELVHPPTNWHQFDALLAYLSGLRYQGGVHLVFGNSEEGQIFV
jgi:predicted nuclease with RNAse H fold